MMAHLPTQMVILMRAGQTANKQRSDFSNMLLLITGSADGTADRIVHRYGEGVFRLNYDLWKEYHLSFTNDGWEIINPAGLTISSDTVSCAYWWKAFSFFALGDDKYVKAEIKYIFKDIYAWCGLQGLVKGNPIEYHNRFGKMTINTMAGRYFTLPKTLVTLRNYGINSLADKTVIAKSLSSEQADDGRVLHTTEVTLDNLDATFPWQLQEKIDSEWDITIFYCNSEVFGFKRSRENLKGLDWRAEQDLSMHEQEWFPYKVEERIKKSLMNLSADLQVEFGRYDFMENTAGKLEFLEFNANGQWVFLDVADRYGLLDCVVDWLKS